MTVTRKLHVRHLLAIVRFTSRELVYITCSFLVKSLKHLNWHSCVWLHTLSTYREALHTVNYRYRCLCQAWNVHSYAKESNGLSSQEQGDGWILRIAYFLDSCIGTDDWWFRYIRDTCWYVCCTMQGRKTRVVWGISRTSECMTL